MVGLCMAQQMSAIQKIILSKSQRQELKLVLRQELGHPDFPDALKGFDGMILADNVLKNQESVGLLVGSLSKSVWNNRTKEEDLEKHYDTDVLVMDENFDSELGIDWFLPKTEIIRGGMLAGDIEEQVTYFQNKYNYIVPGSVSQNPMISLEPGLYIPGRDFVVDGYVSAYLQKSGLGGLDHYVDEDVIDMVRKNVEKKGIRTAVPKFIRERFPVLDYKYTRNGWEDVFRLKSFNEAIWKKLNRDR